MLEQFLYAKSRLLAAYHKYRTYYDQKAAAKTSANQQYCLLLNPSLLTQNDFAAKSTTVWLSLFRVGKLRTKSNYLVRKVGAPYTQSVHRIRLRSITPKYQVEVFSVTIDEFWPDPSLGKFRSEHEILDSALEQSLDGTTFYQHPQLWKKHDEMQHILQRAIAGPAIAVPAAVAAVVGTPDAPAQADVPQVNYESGQGPSFPPPPAPTPEIPVEPENLFS